MPPVRPLRFTCRCLFAPALLVLSLVLLARAGQVSYLAAPAQTYPSQNAAPLNQGSNIDRELAGGETHEFSLLLTAEEFVRVIVEQHGVEVVLTLKASDGKELAEVRSTLGVPNQKRLSFVAESAGEYTLVVRPARKDAARGAYVLKAEEWRHAEARDKSIAAGERAFSEAEALGTQGPAEATNRSLQKYGEALGLWRAAGDRLAEAFTLLRKGLAHHNLGQFKQSIDYYTQSLPIWEEMGNERGVAQVLTNLGWSYNGRGQPQRALDLYTRALEIRRRLNDPRGTAQTLNLQADALNALGEPRRAVTDYLEAVTLARTAADQNIEAYSLNGLAWVHAQMGEYDAGRDFIDRALSIWRKLRNERGEATALNIRGTIYSYWMQVSKAQESYQQARMIQQKLGNRYEEAQTLNNLGVLYYNLADFDRANESYIEALAIWKSIGNRIEESRTLNNIGLISWRTGSLAESLDYFNRALTLNHAAGDRVGEATSLHNTGVVQAALGDTRQALDYFNRALKLYQETGHHFGAATTLNDLAFLHEGLGDDQQAFDYYTQAVQHHFLPAQLGLARLELKRGNLSAARSYVEAVLKTREVRRARILDQEMRVSYNARVHYSFELYAEILMRLREHAVASREPSDEFLATAFESSERAHARGLLETLAESHSDIRKGVEPGLLIEETALREKLNAGEMRRLELMRGGGHEKGLAALEKETEELEGKLNEVRVRIRATSPRYAALTQPKPLSLPAIQRLLDNDTILLEYLLGKDHSFLWVVTTSSVNGYVLPARDEIETSARRMYELLSGSGQSASGESTITAQTHAVEFKEASATLSRLVLGPVAAQLGKKRLLIVSDGVLQYLPFGVLQASVAQGSNVKGERQAARGGEGALGTATPTNRPLIADHEIVYLPSASVLAALRSEKAQHPPAPKTLAVLADPVFNADDSRAIASRTATGKMLLVSSTDKRPKSGPDVERSGHDTGVNDFVRLRFSRQEADMITAFVPEKDRLMALDFAASRATAVSPELGQYRILHFATHGLLNSKHPELSGLVLSLVDEHGQPQDGFLRYDEIYNLTLNADLVVLSACQTALGKEVLGEGLIGLTRAFMYAGAPRVVASLWRVDDRATAELMKQFYRGMLKDGLRPAAALRAAQVSLLNDKRWSAPHYWAGFILQGEWQ